MMLQTAKDYGVDARFENLTLTEKLGRHQYDKFEQLKQKLIREGKVFEDRDFPAEGKLNSLGGGRVRGRGCWSID